MCFEAVHLKDADGLPVCMESLGRAAVAAVIKRCWGGKKGQRADRKEEVSHLLVGTSKIQNLLTTDSRSLFLVISL